MSYRKPGKENEPSKLPWTYRLGSWLVWWRVAYSMILWFVAGYTGYYMQLRYQSSQPGECLEMLIPKNPTNQVTKCPHYLHDMNPNGPDQVFCSCTFRTY